MIYITLYLMTRCNQHRRFVNDADSSGGSGVNLTRQPLVVTSQAISFDLYVSKETVKIRDTTDSATASFTVNTPRAAVTLSRNVVRT